MHDLSTDKCLNRLLTALGLIPEDLTPDEIKSMAWLAESHTEKRGPGQSPGPLFSVDFPLNTQEVQDVLDNLRFVR